ncbi:MAG: hypothetical protein AAF675_18840, partial [Pseudomonadota bacterium]
MSKNWQNRRGRQGGTGEGGWVGGLLRGVISGSAIAGLLIIGSAALLPADRWPSEAPTPAETTRAATDPASLASGADAPEVETAAVREERGRSGPTTSGTFAGEGQLDATSVDAPTRAPTVSAPGGGTAPVPGLPAPAAGAGSAGGFDTAALGDGDASPGLSGLGGGALSSPAGASRPAASASPPGGLAPSSLSPGGLAPSGLAPGGVASSAPPSGSVAGGNVPPGSPAPA